MYCGSIFFVNEEIDYLFIDIHVREQRVVLHRACRCDIIPPHLNQPGSGKKGGGVLLPLVWKHDGLHAIHAVPDQR